MSVSSQCWPSLSTRLTVSVHCHPLIVSPYTTYWHRLIITVSCYFLRSLILSRSSITHHYHLQCLSSYCLFQWTSVTENGLVTTHCQNTICCHCFSVYYYCHPPPPQVVYCIERLYKGFILQHIQLSCLFVQLYLLWYKIKCIFYSSICGFIVKIRISCGINKFFC